MYPAEQTELLLQVPALQRHDETHEAKRIEREADKAVAHGEPRQLSVRKHDMLTGHVSEG